jgi:glutamate formiminotransferase / formiminotetrahydrofolate cyclodeaminase
LNGLKACISNLLSSSVQRTLIFSEKQNIVRVLIECVPNFSTADEKAIAYIASAIRAVKGVHLLFIDKGMAANRTVFTFVGAPTKVCNAAFAAIRAASEVIDMTQHRGEHPRIGATDVCPLVPLRGMNVQDLVPFAQKLGAKVGKELHIPIYLYEAAAAAPHRRNLATVRKGEYEGLAQKMELADWKPDFCPVFNAKTGATVIGARDFLIAYNVNLDTKDVKIAQKIAQNIRTKSNLPTSLPALKAIGWYMEEFDKVQVSMNLTNFRATGIAEAFAACAREAEKLGAKVTGSELIAMSPLQVFLDAAAYFLKEENHKKRLQQAQKVAFAIEKLGLTELKPFHSRERILEWAMKY